MWSLLMAALMVFPNVHARDLDGHVIETDALRGAPVVYMLGFTYESRHAVESWASYIGGLPGAPRTIQMPVYSGFSTLVRPWIDQSMARNTPAAVHHDVLTTTDHDPLVRGLGLEHPEREAAIVLVDAKGQVVLIERGAPTDEARARMAKALHGLH
jgi:hypothetical protein